MSDSVNKAVFLSYASQDAEAARRICDALRSGGVEVWFDADGGLEHGDEWDAKIRRQVKECVLFIAVISANTQAREEGYFRIEWELAAQRALGIASGVPFILPVVIDDTREPDALVPDRFRAVQWTKLPGGMVSPEVKARYLKLWSHRTGVLRNNEAMAATAAQEMPAAISARDVIGKPGAKNYALVGVAILAVVAGAGWWLLGRKTAPPSPPSVSAVAATGTPPALSPLARLSEARQLIAKTGGLMDALDNSRDDYKLAEEMIAQAKAKDPMDAEVWAAEAQLHERYLIRGWDLSDARREAARAATQRAIRLDPQSFEVRFAQANLLADTGRDAPEKERLLRELRREQPTDKRVLRALAGVIDHLDRMDESAAIADESASLPGGDPLALYNKSMGFWFAGRTAEAEAGMEASLHQQPFTGALLIAAWYRLALHGDPDGARNFLLRIDPAQMSEDRAAFFASFVEYLAHRPDAAIARLQAMPRDWLNDFWHRGPKGLLVGSALEMGGRHDAAVIEWTAALKLVEQRLAASPTNTSLIYNRVRLLFHLDQRAEAERQFSVLLQMRSAVDIGSSDAVAKCHALLGHKAEALKVIAKGLTIKTHAVAFPSGLLRLDPVWDALRGEPEFAKLIAEAERLERATGAAVTRAEEKPAAADKSVAVLAFANRSDDATNEIFSDGISEELINVLGRVPGLTVKGRSSSFFFKGKDATAQEKGQRLGATYLVDGSVRKAGNSVRITAQLIRAATDEVVWSSEPITKELKDVLAVQEEIAGLIAQNLQLKLGAASRPAPAVNPEAHRLVLEGRHFWGPRTEDGFNRAEAAFRQARDLDPEFAPAHAGLALLEATRVAYAAYVGEARRPSELLWTAARRALELDPSLAEGHAALAYGFFNEGRVAESEREYQKALALNPNSALLHHWYSLTLENAGRLDEALAEIARATALDPLSGIALVTQERMAMAAGRYSEALELHERVVELLPEIEAAIGLRAICLLQLGRTDDAASAARQVSPQSSLNRRVNADAQVIHVLRQTGHAAEAATHATQIMARFRPESYQRGFVLAAQGRWAEAVPFLERTPQTLQYLYFWDPMWDAMRGDPKFAQLVAKLGCTEEYRLAREVRARMVQKEGTKK